MWKENLYQPVEVLTRKHTKFPIDEHQHSFFEMVYVQSGSGSFYVKEGDFKVQQKTEFLGEITTIQAVTGEQRLLFVPYYAWDNREAGKMKVWIDYQE